MDKKSRSIPPMEVEKVDHVADVEAAEDSVAVASAVEVAVDTAEAAEVASAEDSAVAVEADSVAAVEVAEAVGVITAIKMDILLANVLRAAKTTLVVEIATKKPNYQDEVN